VTAANHQNIDYRAMKFSIRDLLLVTVIVAILAAWWVDRSKLAWSHSQALATADNLRSKLDTADPGWRTRSPPNPIVKQSSLVAWSPVAGYAIAVGLVAIFILILVLVWKKQIHPSILEKRGRF
jgi:hypothetical protein